MSDIDTLMKEVRDAPWPPNYEAILSGDIESRKHALVLALAGAWKKGWDDYESELLVAQLGLLRESRGGIQ